METLLDRMRRIHEKIAIHCEEIESLQGQLKELFEQWEKEEYDYTTASVRKGVRSRIVSEEASFPCGAPPTPEEVKKLLEEITCLDALEPAGRVFIQTQYPRLRETRAWPELRQALQKKFGLKRQQVASFAAHTVGKHQNRKRVT